MDKENLLISAKELQQPSEEVANEYGEKKAKLVSEVDRIMLSRSDLTNLIGENNEAMMQDNHKNHALFMESIFKSYEPEVLIETVVWVFKAYLSHNFHETYWSAQLNAWFEVMKNELSEKAYGEIQSFYNFLIINIPVFSTLANSES